MISTGELAGLLGVSRQTIYNYLAKGRFPPTAIVWFGKVPKYRIDILERHGWLRTGVKA